MNCQPYINFIYYLCKFYNNIFTDQFTALNEELERRRDECIQLKSVLASRAKDSITTAKQNYGGHAEILNEVCDLELAL